MLKHVGREYAITGTTCGRNRRIVDQDKLYVIRLVSEQRTRLLQHSLRYIHSEYRLKRSQQWSRHPARTASNLDNAPPSMVAAKAVVFPLASDGNPVGSTVCDEFLLAPRCRVAPPLTTHRGHRPEGVLRAPM